MRPTREEAANHAASSWHLSDRRYRVDQQSHAKYLIEAYVPTNRTVSVGDHDVRLRRAAQEMAAEGTAIRHLDTLLIPEEEICFFVFEACSPEDVAELSRRAEIGYERIVRAL
jgi:hypothetical protein